MRQKANPITRGLTCLLLTFIASPLLQAQPGDSTFQTYRSTKLGFSADYPADWVKYTLGICIGGIPPNSREEWERMSIAPIRFAKGNSETYDTYFTVHFTRRFDGDLYDFLSKREEQSKRAGGHNTYSFSASTEFRSATGESGRRFVRHDETEQFIEQPPYTESFDESTIYYAFVVNGRAFELSGQCPTQEFESTRGIFDAIAGSLRIFEPYSPASQATPWATYQGLGFAFDYPGGWSAQMDDDDAVNVRQRAEGEFRVSGPLLWNDRWSGFAPSIYSSTFPDEPGKSATIADAEDEFVTNMQGRPGYDLAFSSYRNKDGVECREVNIRFAFANWRTTRMRVFLLQRSDGRVQTLACNCFDDDTAIWDKVFDLVRYSFVATR